MGGIQVVTDSACDLTPAQAEERGIRVVPLTIRFGTEEFVDQIELSSKEFWDRVVTGPAMPETSAPSLGAFQEAFLEAAEAGADGVVCVNLSSKLSATHQSALAAAEAVAGTIPVRVVDSLTATMGEGVLVLAVADLVDEGKGLEEVAAAAEDLRADCHVYSSVGSLDYLKKGGRIGGAAHLVGSLLSIRPVIEIRDGAVAVESKQRTRARALQYLADKVLDAGPLVRLAVPHGMAEDIGDFLALIEKVNPLHEVIVTELGPVVGSHAGPGTLGVCYQRAR